MHINSDFSTLWTADYTAMLSLSSDQKIPGTSWCLWQNAMTLPCIELAATKAAFEARLLAAKPIHQRKRIPTANPLEHQHPGTQAKERPPLRRGRPPNPISQVRLKCPAARQKEPVSTVAKADTWQMNAQRKKLRPTMFAPLRKAQTVAKATMSPIQTAQTS